MLASMCYPEADPPSPISFNGEGDDLGAYIVRLSAPLTHFVKFLTGSSLTFSKPSAKASLCIYLMASSSWADPHILGPQVSLR
jgi:hypothetical protein